MKHKRIAAIFISVLLFATILVEFKSKFLPTLAGKYTFDSVFMVLPQKPIVKGDNDNDGNNAGNTTENGDVIDEENNGNEQGDEPANKTAIALSLKSIVLNITDAHSAPSGSKTSSYLFNDTLCDYTLLYSAEFLLYQNEKSLEEAPLKQKIFNADILKDSKKLVLNKDEKFTINSLQMLIVNGSINLNFEISLQFLHYKIEPSKLQLDLSQSFIPISFNVSAAECVDTFVYEVKELSINDIVTFNIKLMFDAAIVTC